MPHRGRPRLHDYDDIAGLHAQGLSSIEIARRLNMPRGSVAWILKRLGLAKPRDQYVRDLRHAPPLKTPPVPTRGEPATTPRQPWEPKTPTLTGNPMDDFTWN